jgi:hypothetical protein
VAEGQYSKREVSRAGRVLADRLEALRQGRRTAVVELRDAEAKRARDIVEWWRAEHVGPMLSVYEKVLSVTPELDVGERRLTAVSFRPKSIESTIAKLAREPGKLADWSSYRTKSMNFTPSSNLSWRFDASEIGREHLDRRAIAPCIYTFASKSA